MISDELAAKLLSVLNNRYTELFRTAKRHDADSSIDEVRTTLDHVAADHVRPTIETNAELHGHHTGFAMALGLVQKMINESSDDDEASITDLELSVDRGCFGCGDRSVKINLRDLKDRGLVTIEGNVMKIVIKK